MGFFDLLRNKSSVDPYRTPGVGDSDRPASGPIKLSDDLYDERLPLGEMPVGTMGYTNARCILLDKNRYLFSKSYFDVTKGPSILGPDYEVQLVRTSEGIEIYGTRRATKEFDRVNYTFDKASHIPVVNFILLEDPVK